MQSKPIPSFFILFVLVSLAALSACAPQAEATPTPTSTAAAALGQPFTSERFWYMFEYPAGWIVKDKPGDWADFDPLDPNRGAGIDAFAAYLDGRNLALGIGARPLPEGTTLEAWSESAQALIKSGVSRGVCYEGIEDDPVSIEQTTLDDEPAILLEYVCPNSFDKFGLVLLAIHNGQGYWITWLGPQGNAAEDRAEFTRILNSFVFTD